MGPLKGWGGSAVCKGGKGTAVSLAEAADSAEFTHPGGGVSLVEVCVVGALILLGDWRRYAREASTRQEAGRREAAS